MLPCTMTVFPFPVVFIPLSEDTVILPEVVTVSVSSPFIVEPPFLDVTAEFTV